MTTSILETLSAARLKSLLRRKFAVDPDTPSSAGKVLRPIEYISVRNLVLEALGIDPDTEEDLPDELYGSPLELLRPFCDAKPSWAARLVPGEVDDFLGWSEDSLIVCGNPGSMMSGAWGLNYFVLGGRGYIVHEPDYGVGADEGLPILAGWAPGRSYAAFEAAFCKTYARSWTQLPLPPMGEAASGPPDLIARAIVAAGLVGSFDVDPDPGDGYDAQQLAADAKVPLADAEAAMGAARWRPGRRRPEPVLSERQEYALARLYCRAFGIR